MKITITAHCTFCARKFCATSDSRPYDPQNNRVVCDDMDGRLCCADCLCGYCGRGHVLDEDFGTCANESYMESEWSDPDAFRDSVWDVHAGVI